MRPTLGWTQLSREALRRVEDQLYSSEKGVLDEMGFLELHQAYANRFFPGTSVLQTRLRYALFVPWVYEDAARAGSSDAAKRIDIAEIELAGRLKKAGENGIIGGLTYPKLPSQPASSVYWNGLGTWGVLRRATHGTTPSKRVVHQQLRRQRRVERQQLSDADGQSLDIQPDALFVTLPRRPDDWSDPGTPLDFRLTIEEVDFFREYLGSVPSVSSPQSLLGRIAESGISVNDYNRPWLLPDEVVADERPALMRASQAAALAAIGRAVYAALVEHTRSERDSIPTDNIHRNWLETTIEKYGTSATALDIDTLNEDFVLSNKLKQVLWATQHKLNTGAHFETLYPTGRSSSRLRQAFASLHNRPPASRQIRFGSRHGLRKGRDWPGLNPRRRRRPHPPAPAAQQRE